jgi:7,8-dihydropterin-6-yl-methyl-4-(beta-D-ribofuranosyl)aminobenzene 5'-phosphate synthase
MKAGKLLALTVALLAIAGPLSACVPRITQTGPLTVPTPSFTVLAPPPAATPTLERAGDDVVLLTWHREGGIAGFCDDLVVYADGQVAISLCKDSQPKAPKSLSSEQMEQLRRWVETYQSFEFEQRDEAVADGMAIRMTFAGKGSQEATKADKQAMLAFAAALASSAPVPTATPGPTNTPLATATVAPTITSPPTALPLSRTIPSEEVRELRITIVYDNNAYDARLRAAWGFAALIEYGEHVLLFDTGGDGPTLMGNMAKLGLDPQAIQVVVLSHIHGDHVGGLQALLDTGVKPTVYVPASFPSSFKRSVRGRTLLVEVSESTQILSGIYSTGELGVSIIEQALVVETGEGTVVITGCAHPGITKIVRVAKEIVPGEVALAIGGFHLAEASQRSIGRIIDRFLELDVRRVSPTHCTGERAIAMFADVYGEAYVEGGVGRVITIGGRSLPPLPAPTSTPTPLPVSVYLELVQCCSCGAKSITRTRAYNISSARISRLWKTRSCQANQ